MDIDVVWVAVSVYMIVLVVYGSYLLRGWIRMRREHRDAWERYRESQELKYKYKIVDVNDGSLAYHQFIDDLYIATCVCESLNRDFGNKFTVADITEEVSDARIF